ncbi:MAG: preprotein translocase subunit SecG [Prevotella sp.]|nr:preprotein translocase subunit SecG [Prevotella sp.]
MYTLFVIIIVFAALLMIGIVLIQESKGGGLSSNFSSANALAGVRKTTDLVEKITWGLAVSLVVLSVACAYTAPTASTQQSAMEKTTENPLANPRTQQNFGASQQQQAPAQGAQQQAPAQQQPAAKQ